MKIANIETRPERTLRLLTQFDDMQHADGVGCRLARHDDVALGRLSRCIARHRHIVEVILNHLLARPTLCMQAGIDHQTYSARQLKHESAKVGIRI